MGLFKRITVATAMLGAASIIVAPLAMATDYTASACSNLSRYVVVGDSITFVFDPATGCTYGGGDAEIVRKVAGTSNFEDLSSGGVTRFRVVFTGPEGFVFAFNDIVGTCAPGVFGPASGPNDPVLVGSLGTYTALPLCGFGVVVEEAGQNLVRQSIGRSGQCDATHGWLASWQEWTNSGRGGPVCERTLLYVDSIGDYVVGQWNEAGNKYVPWEGATV